MPRSKRPSNPVIGAPSWLTFGPTVCSELELALEKEWWMTSTLGAYASATILGCLTRSRHGLLVVPAKPHEGLISLLAKYEETLYILDQPFPLSTNCFHETIFPKGYAHLKRFSLSPFPTFTYEVEDFRLEKVMYFRCGENTLVTHYQLISGEEEMVRLEVRPLVTCRPAGEVHKTKKGIAREMTSAKGLVCFRASRAVPPLYLAHQAAIVDKAGEWFGEVKYPRDEERGEPSTEYLYQPCTFIYSFMARDEVMLVASTQPVSLPETPSDWLTSERDRSLGLRQRFSGSAIATPKGPATDIEELRAQSEYFLVRHSAGDLDITRGYLDGNDSAWAAMIALAGLLVVPGRYEEAKEILLKYISLINKGFMPSRFHPRTGAPLYESIDASLWFAEAAFLYAEASEDYETVEKKIYPALRRIIKYYETGTHHGVRVDADGLIEQTDSKIALTWMNAEIRGVPVTPRPGKAVEVNALWYNAIRITELFAIKLRDGETAKAMDALALKVYGNFTRFFWSDKKALLYDVVQGSRKDASVRPNQIISMALSFPALEKKYWMQVLQTVTQELFTPFGLRTLSKRSRGYRGKFFGDRTRRAQAEHQGTVWAWLMGPYVRAYLRTYGSAKPVRERLLRLFEPLLNLVNHHGLNSISSAYDGNAPHTARGLIADACAAAEVTRSYDDLMSEGPRDEVLKEFELR